MKILIVGGSFDDNGGRPSSVASKFANEISDYLQKKEFYDSIKAPMKLEDKSTLKIYNGGHFNEMENILQEVADTDVVFWWANVPNDKPKIRNVKEVNSRCMLVTSKRNDNEKYNFGELVNRALGAKANLCVEFSKQDNRRFQMMVFDPLGNCWYKGTDISECTKEMIERLMFLKDITRQGCVQTNYDETGKKLPSIEIPDETEFFNLIRQNAEVFHELINPAPGVTRFLGNSSFRCQRGFPSFRDGKIVYVSKRNVDKRYIGKDAFVPTWLGSEIGSDDPRYQIVRYQGEAKPSVDTPIQLRLYEYLPNIHYMIHAHVYVEGAPFTNKMIPCGGLEEVGEVLDVLQDNYGDLDKDFYIVNLVGHGSIVMSRDVEQIKSVRYVGRTLPEVQTKQNEAEFDIER